MPKGPSTVVCDRQFRLFFKRLKSQTAARACKQQVILSIQLCSGHNYKSQPFVYCILTCHYMLFGGHLVVNRVCFWLRSLRHTNCWTNALPSDIKLTQKTKQLKKNFILKWHNQVNPNVLPLLPVSQQDERTTQCLFRRTEKKNTDLFSCWQSLGVNVCYVQYSREFLEGSF